MKYLLAMRGISLYTLQPYLPEANRCRCAISSVSNDTKFLPYPGATVNTSSKSVLQGVPVINVVSKDCVSNADNEFSTSSGHSL